MDKICKWIANYHILYETENDDVEDKASPANELPHMELMDGHDSRHSWDKSGVFSVCHNHHHYHYHITSLS